MASRDLPPYPKSGLRLFVHSQFCAKPIPPPASTTLVGKTAVITGSNTGIGLECSRQFLALNLSHLIMAVRSPQKGEAAATPLRKAFPNARIEVWTLDMGDYTSIQNFAQRCRTELPDLDIAILNAGMTQLEFKTNAKTGHEEMFQINYLSTALLALLMLPVLNKEGKGGPGRLTIVSSGVALMADFPNHAANPLIPSFNVSKGWDLGAANERYSVTKTLLLMFVEKLSTNVRSTSIIINTVDPGFVAGSSLHRNMKGVVRAALGIMKAATARTLEQGAWTYVDAAVVKGESSHGSFVMDWKNCPYNALMYTEAGKQTTERLWEETLEELRFAGVADIVRSMG